MCLLLILVGVTAYVLINQIPAVRINRLIRKAKGGYYDLYAATITRKLGDGGVYRSGDLEVRHSGDSSCSWESTEILWHGKVVFEMTLNRFEIPDGDTSYSKSVKGYIPGQWETIIEDLYETIHKKEKDDLKQSNRPSRERFGL